MPRLKVDDWPPQVTQYGYDTLGNLTNYAGVAQSYDHPTAPHRLTQSGSSSLFDYDEAGRLKSDSWREFTYNRFDLPTNVQTSAYSVDFEYGPFGQRVLKKRFGDTTVYVSDLYERRQTQFETHHVFRVPGIAEVRWKANADGSYEEEVNYIHHDHLGSVASVSNGGSGVQTQRFTPFGRRMDDFGDVTGAPANPQTPYGFTGHEHDDAAGLINMRGRVYDPTYGRMLTPDPIVSDALSAGSWNPYSYVGNSPLSFTDPSGFVRCDVPGRSCGGGTYYDPFEGEGGSGNGRYTHPDSGGNGPNTGLGGPGVHGESYAPWNDPKPPGHTPSYHFGPDLSTVDFSYDHNAGQPYTNQRRHSDNLGNFAGGFGDRPRYANAVIVGGSEIGFNRITQFLWDQLTRPSPMFSLCDDIGCDKTHEEPYYGGEPPAGPRGVGQLVTNGVRTTASSGVRKGAFNLAHWKGYPSGVPKPMGPFRLIEGAEYDAARTAANNANAALRRANPAKYAGKQIHEIHPVKFGGSPTDPANKISLTPKEHAKYTTFWNRLMRQIQ